MTETERLAERYRQMPDERLLQIALREAAGLTPEALRVLNGEVQARGIDPAVGLAVEAQTRTLSRRDVDLLVDAVQKRPCPECGQTARPLNGGLVATAKSFVVFTAFSQHTLVACPECLTAEAKRASLVTMALGWWGLPSGPIQSIKALSRNRATVNQGARDEPSEVLREFVASNPGVATAMLSS
jgi:hypothetical protein